MIFSPATTALVLVDLQARTLGMLPWEPYSGERVAAVALELRAAFHAAGARVFVVQHDYPDGEGAELVFTLDEREKLITKRTVGAFHQTGLDEELRAANAKTVVFAGIATNFGVESSLRAALDLGYEVVAVSDAMTSIDAGSHEVAVSKIFPQLGRVVTAAELLGAQP
ncbi:cysteine hydrolase family protein [Amycolatopsis sp. YIM 10]|uniref:cysteine hydrolase family protein n=1 Tax=Amycolatopsis sp. YIM 10 TaxID=2653857 RepID=UPI00128FDEE9|nr:isochorismatase family protein [Amycolatopsis sp. YIM 10]QFU86170.1 Isochorismatase family protein YecD [Amycolatopsis sp. YIM 10]